MTDLSSPRIPVSWGELIDKIAILQIKHERIGDPTALANVARELTELAGIAAEALGRAELAALFAALKAVNLELWDIEDAIRREEARAAFGPEFIRLARAVYQHNDRRAALKRDINRVLQSELSEEKSYWSASPGVEPASAPT